MSRRFLRMPVAAGFGGLLTYVFNLAVLRPIYLNDIDELSLAERYFSLDLNADMMRGDLEEFGFKIRAKHFNLEKAQEDVHRNHFNNQQDNANK